eukprot:scaffold196579_cov30-Prasinocladus_malaysianus.AAC.2
MKFGLSRFPHQISTCPSWYMYPYFKYAGPRSTSTSTRTSPYSYIRASAGRPLSRRSTRTRTSIWVLRSTPAVLNSSEVEDCRGDSDYEPVRVVSPTTQGTSSLHATGIL